MQPIFPNSALGNWGIDHCDGREHLTIKYAEIIVVECKHSKG